MTLADWDVQQSHHLTSVAIEGDRLRIDNAADLSEARQIVSLRRASQFPRGYVKGRWRTKIEITDQLLRTSTEGHYGLSCMWSQADIVTRGGGGAAYLFGLFASSTLTWRLSKYLDGISTSSSSHHTILAEGSTLLDPALAVGYTIELEWAYHELIGGIRLICQAGLAANDYSDLQTVYNVTDSANPLITSVGEGLFWGDLEGFIGPDLKRVYFDDTYGVPLDGTVIT